MSARGRARRRAIVDIHLVLRDADRILLGRRQNTGFADGLFHLPAGHVEARETVVDAVIREAREELGVAVDAADLQLLHVMHNGDGDRVAFFFQAMKWRGEITNREPEKCAALRWFRIDRLPAQIVPYARVALEAALVRREPLSLFGFA